ncbi:hypothetical protein Tco_0446254, partial [Tanacetum coccineum]
KKSTTMPTAGVVIIDTLGVSISKKKAPAKGDRGKGMELLSDAALLEVARVPNESQDKTIGTDVRTGTKPGVPDVPTYESESENESWGDNQDDESNDDDDDDNDSDNKDGESKDDDGNSDANDNERTDSDDDDRNPSFTLKDYDEEEHDEKYESDDDNDNVYEEEDDDLYKDVNVRSLGAEHEKERKGDAEMTDADKNKTESLKQSSSVSSDFASKFLILENIPTAVDEVASMMNVKIRQEESSTQAPSLFTVPETVIPETATAHTTIVPPTIVSTLETELSQLKQVDHFTQLLESVKSQLPTMVDDLLSTRIRYATRTALQSHTKEFEKKTQENRKLYIDVVKKSVKDIIKDEVKSLLPQILPKEVSDFANPVIQSTITESLKNVVLAKSSLEKSKSYRASEDHRNLYDALIKSYQLDKDLFDSYGKAYSLKRNHEDKDKDEDPPTGPNQCLKKRKTSKDVEPPRSFKSKDS